jgi:hypothetical protein
MIRCNSALLKKAIAGLGPNGLTKFAANAGVSVSTIHLCLREEAPKKPGTRLAIARAAALTETALFWSENQGPRELMTKNIG